MNSEQIAAAAWRHLLEAAPLLCLRLDAGGRVIEANRFARERCGSDPVGRRLDEVFLSFGAPLAMEDLRQDPERSRLLHLATAGDAPETLQVHGLPVGAETLVFGYLDADETGRLRRELIDLTNRLNALTRELQKKNHELAELNRLKDQFLGMAAHDLRKPVGAILSYSEFLIDEAGPALNAEHLGFLRTIRASTDLMRRVIDDFLDIAMIESGRFEMQRTTTDLLAPVQQAAALNRIPARRKGIELAVAGDTKPLWLVIDSAKIEQVLNNLIANAIEHSPSGSTVEVHLAATASEAVVRVIDAGPGIALDEREGLFQPFARGKARKTGGVRSTGLGLAISKKIVEAHGGRIWIEDAPGRGAVFAFGLPGPRCARRH